MQVAQLHANEQYQKLRNEFTLWKGETEQLDDVLVMGVRIK